MDNKYDFLHFGDIKVDRNLWKDPMKMSDLKLLIPGFNDFLASNQLCQIDWEGSKFYGLGLSLCM